ncbi:hypothetical protein C2845_PM05G34860 [Panicum miliaceum]|uniref:Uncharacterized protein n=1 Tax=Panicum miliaceum TaxID=4540 RepID=A0A3L6T3B3_PANMI|nr:hypothetical protein C2845_PM05G34860 [Panicum miliaceum]
MSQWLGQGVNFLLLSVTLGARILGPSASTGCCKATFLDPGGSSNLCDQGRWGNSAEED